MTCSFTAWKGFAGRGLWGGAFSDLSSIGITKTGCEKYKLFYVVESGITAALVERLSAAAASLRIRV